MPNFDTLEDLPTVDEKAMLEGGVEQIVREQPYVPVSEKTPHQRLAWKKIRPYVAASIGGIGSGMIVASGIMIVDGLASKYSGSGVYLTRQAPVALTWLYTAIILMIARPKEGEELLQYGIRRGFQPLGFASSLIALNAMIKYFVK